MRRLGDVLLAILLGACIAAWVSIGSIEAAPGRLSDSDAQDATFLVLDDLIAVEVSER